MNFWQICPTCPKPSLINASKIIDIYRNIDDSRFLKFMENTQKNVLPISRITTIYGQILIFLHGIFYGMMVSSPLLAQAPNDEWRRGGLDAMVAQPGKASSILSNPAGIKTKIEPHENQKKKRKNLRNADRNSQKYKPNPKYDWITEIISVGLFLSKDIWKILKDIEGVTKKIEDEIKDLENITEGTEDYTASPITVSSTLPDLPYNMVSLYSTVGGLPTEIPERIPDDFDITKLNKDQLKKLTEGLKRIPKEKYVELTKDVPSLPKDQEKLTTKNLEDDAVKKDLTTSIKSNISLGEIVSGVGKGFINGLFDDLGNLGFKLYSRTFGISHVNDQNPLAWGFYFGLEQKVALRTGVDSKLPLSLKLPGIDSKLDAEVKLAFQFYLSAPLRIAFAHDFDELLPGFTFGLGFKVAPYFGTNQEAFGRILSQVASGEEFEVVDLLIPKGGTNIGLDFGLQFHFGALSPKLSFLHAGLKISDFLGLNIPILTKNEDIRYPLDFDLGLYAEKWYTKYLKVFGGLELIQIRGMLPKGQSPYSALFEPIDHLRLLLGIGLFNNTIHLTLQYYQQKLSPSIAFNLDNLQLYTALSFDSSTQKGWGMQIGIRFRSPRNGYSRQKPYKTYAQRATEKGQTLPIVKPSL